MATALSSNPHVLRRLAPGLSSGSLKRMVDSHGTQLRLKSHINHRRRHRKSRGLRTLSTEDDRELAADRNLVLPSDKPRLERQEAFRLSRTTWPYSDADDDSYDLYRLGLLYDDEHLRGSGFNLDTIVHPEPVYTICPAKRSRKYRARQVERWNPRPAPRISSTSPYDGIALAKLRAPEADESLAVGSASLPSERRSSSTIQQDIPLATIYESQESSMLSPPPTPPATALPDLFLDEEDFTLLDDEVSDLDDGYSIEDAPSATGDPWIMLGDGS